MSIRVNSNFLVPYNTAWVPEKCVIDSPGPDILHIDDQFEQDLIDLLVKHFPDAEYMISDHVINHENHYDFRGRTFIGLPLFLLRAIQYQVAPGVSPLDYKLVTDKCCNFMINKKLINRFLCIKLTEWFSLDCNYTWSGTGVVFDMSDVIHELNHLRPEDRFDKSLRAFLLSPIKINPNFIVVPSADSGPSGDNVVNYGGNGLSWKHGIDHIFLTSAVSLITETVQFAKLSTFTEKTAYSVIGCTFPIWVGGYNQAQEWAKLGFDTFDDIIDHSYQNYPTLVERCYHAFAKNLDILTNIDLARKLREDNTDRLIANRQLLFSDHLLQTIVRQIDALPKSIQPQLNTLLDFYINESKKQLRRAP